MRIQICRQTGKDSVLRSQAQIAVTLLLQTCWFERRLLNDGYLSTAVPASDDDIIFAYVKHAAVMEETLRHIGVEPSGKRGFDVSASLHHVLYLFRYARVA